MADHVSKPKLTVEGALKAVNAGMRKARSIKVPQCISVVDDGGNLVAFARMDGARFLSVESSLHKAMTAASSGRPTGPREAGLEIKIAVTTGGKNIALLGGIPIIVKGCCIGAVGVGSGTGEQDREVALAAVASISGARKRF
ncbi:MAG: heme-binding protein [Burkholderiales bacterium]|nr:heme-binding protein [Burkholderiales bacterium]